MSENIQVSSSPVVAVLPWHQVWLRAITRPSVATFQELVRDPSASPGRAYKWAFLTALIAYLVIALILFTMMGIQFAALSAQLPATFFPGEYAVSLLVLSPVSAGFAVLGLTIVAGLTNWIARLLGGTGNYGQLVYAFASFVAPMVLAISLLSLIPTINCLTPLLTIYVLVLMVIAVKAVHGFGWGRAAISPLILPGIFLLCDVLIIVTFAIVGSNLSQ